MGADTRLPPYLPYPRFLLQADLTQTAKLLITEKWSNYYAVIQSIYRPYDRRHSRFTMRTSFSS